MPSFEALARLFGGEELIETGRWAEGEAELENALTFYRAIGATFHGPARREAARAGSERFRVSKREAVGHPGEEVHCLVSSPRSIKWSKIRRTTSCAR